MVYGGSCISGEGGGQEDVRCLTAALRAPALGIYFASQAVEQVGNFPFFFSYGEDETRETGWDERLSSI